MGNRGYGRINSELPTSEMTKSTSKNNLEEKNDSAEPVEEIVDTETKAVETKKVSTTDASVVTSTQTIDFPSFGWGIHAGEERELPENADARKEILSNPHISVIN